MRGFTKTIELLGLEVILELPDPKAPMGRFGGGWDYELGFQLACSKAGGDLILNLLLGSVRIRTLKHKRASEEIGRQNREWLRSRPCFCELREYPYALAHCHRDPQGEVIPSWEKCSGCRFVTGFQPGNWEWSPRYEISEQQRRGT